MDGGHVVAAESETVIDLTLTVLERRSDLLRCSPAVWIGLANEGQIGFLDSGLDEISFLSSRQTRSVRATLREHTSFCANHVHKAPMTPIVAHDR
jgi:hypothetical protein